jgi:stress response protein YsnF
LNSFGALEVDDYDKKISTLNDRDAVEGNKNLSNSDESIQVMKEDIAIGKREVETGGRRIKTRIIEKPVEETIRLRDERVYVTRKPMNKEVSNADAF